MTVINPLFTSCLLLSLQGLLEEAQPVRELCRLSYLTADAVTAALEAAADEDEADGGISPMLLASWCCHEHRRQHRCR